MSNSTQNSRRLFPLLLATTLAPLVCLGWLGWRVVEEDRRQQGDRAQEQREQAADLAASALQRVLAEAEERLASFSTPPGVVGTEAGGLTLIAFEGAGVLERGGTPLPYYPAIPKSPQLDVSLFTGVDESEFQEKDLQGALQTLETLAANNREKPAVLGAILLRKASLHRKLGEDSKALAAYSEVERLGDALVGGVPAALRARQGRGVLFEATGRREELQQEAATLCDDLENGRWMLSAGDFEFNHRQAVGWFGTDRPPIDADRRALAEAADVLWREWQTTRTLGMNSRGRRTVPTAGLSVSALMRSTPDRATALLMTPRFLESAWLGAVRSPERETDFDFALTDSDGHTVLGQPDASASTQLVRPVPATPWTMHVISRPLVPAGGLSGQTKLVLAGIVMMGLLAVAGGFLIHRAILRELRVARLQSDFVAAVSHEFRTPLTTVRQLAEMLVKGRVSSDERRQQFYETLLWESERLHRLVEGLLNFGRMEAGHMRYRFEPVDPKGFVRDVVADFEKEVSGKGYHIELSGGDHLPPIRADRESLARVFWNLLDNAVKYSPENRTIGVTLSNGGRRLAVRVSDHGMGIPEEEQKKIFQKFVRGAASKDAGIQGAGVGLAMARQIVVAHGGDISVESSPGKGSVFTVLLPMAVEP